MADPTGGFTTSPGVVSATITAIATVIVAVVSSVFTFLAARTKLVREAQAETRVFQRELSFQTVSMGFDEFAKGMQEIENDIRDLIDTTPVDRVLALKGWNGANDMRFVTAFFQLREDGQRVVNYANFPTDRDYVNRIYEIRGNGAALYEVRNIPNSKIMQAYLAEGVKCSLWVYGMTFKLIDSDSHCVFFMSFASHSDSILDRATEAACERICDRLTAMVRGYHTIHPDTEPLD